MLGYGILGCFCLVYNVLWVFFREDIQRREQVDSTMTFIIVCKGVAPASFQRQRQLSAFH